LTGPVRLIFLGGAAEIGRNMLVLEHGNDLVIVDCGVGFPRSVHPGIDLLLPNFDYVRQRASKLRGIFITHGHEDHIGALPHLLREVNAPVYATRFTRGIIASRLEEARIHEGVLLNEFDSASAVVLEAGVFSFEPFRVTHSIPDCAGFAISTPAGLIIHTGDFKFDPSPPDDRWTDTDKLRRFAERGVRALISDTTHIEAVDWVPSERVVGDTIERVFAAADGRILFATFSSHVARIQQVVDAAERHGRKIAFGGRGMESTVAIAQELGFLRIAEGTTIDINDALNVPDSQLALVLTGSQGERSSSLGRIAAGEHRSIKIGSGDTVVISAVPIPGNEFAVYEIINQLSRQGADVIYHARGLVHVSGHGSRAEIREMVELTKARHFLPFHGEHRHLALFEDLISDLGLPNEMVTIADVGEVIEIGQDHVEIAGRIPADPVYLDGALMGTAEDVVLHDRQIMGDDGVVMIVVTLDRESGSILVGPEVMSRGFALAGDSRELLDATRERVIDVLLAYSSDNHKVDVSALSRLIRNRTLDFLHKETGLRPLVLPAVMEA
jgi:ribonuclease J